VRLEKISHLVKALHSGDFVKGQSCRDEGHHAIKSVPWRDLQMVMKVEATTTSVKVRMAEREGIEKVPLVRVVSLRETCR
jgi:uncharacterized protein (DUF1786 family)